LKFDAKLNTCTRWTSK